MAKEEVRIDKWMWATRIFRRISLLKRAKKSWISMNIVTVKPSLQ
ncbi:MAG: hypothetical protein ACLRRG_01425 [Barnesiella sp.]